MNDAYGDPRNYDPNDQDPFDWNNFDPTWGNTPPPSQPPQTAAPPPTTSTPPPTTGGGTTRNPNAGPDGSTNPNMDPPGYKGGYWMNGQWVQGSPYSGGFPGGEDTNFDAVPNPNEGFQWPTYNAPRFGYQAFPGFKPFEQPSMDQILADPVLQAQLKEGQRGIKQDRAFRGILNTGDTLKDIFDWTSGRVKLGANDAFDRAFKVYDINERQNPFNTWTANKGLALDTFNANAPQARDEYFYNQYEPARHTFEDNYNRWKAQGDWLSNLSQPPA